MSSRKRHHTRSSFNDLVHPDFHELAREYPDFGRAWHIVQQKQRDQGGPFASNVTQEFSLALCRASLQAFFSLSLPQIPTLCPPVPNRYFFVRWIQQQVLPLSADPSYFEPNDTEALLSSSESKRVFYGVDLGTGATAIYPLLFCAATVGIEDDRLRQSDWKWIASELDPTSVEMARKNVQTNQLQQKIQIILVPPTDAQQRDVKNANKIHYDNDAMEVSETLDETGQVVILAGPLARLLEVLPQQSSTDPPPTHFDIVMTNPPFHEVNSAVVTDPLRPGDQRPRTTLTNHEASYPGGEEAFVLDMLVDSLQILNSHSATENGGSSGNPSITWYSSMFGKKTTFTHMKHILIYLLGPARVLATEFGPGHMTRWFLAWTFRKPNVKSPLASYHHHDKHDATNQRQQQKKMPTQQPTHQLSFDVNLSNENCNGLNDAVVQEVAHRVIAYCRTLPGYNLRAEMITANSGANSQQQTIVIQEEVQLAEEWDRQRLPLPVLEVLRRKNLSFVDFLPKEGHFVADVLITQISPSKASVQFNSFVHSLHGDKVIEKIKIQLQAEVCRTSRRWRRLLKRQQPEHQEQSMET